LGSQPLTTPRSEQSRYIPSLTSGATYLAQQQKPALVHTTCSPKPSTEVPPMSQFHDSIGRAEKTGILQGNLACFGPEARRRRPRVAKKRCGPMASGDALWEWDSRRWTRVFCFVQGCKGKMRSFASVVRCGGLEDLQKMSNLTNKSRSLRSTCPND
jgi:hypothetical protein